MLAQLADPEIYRAAAERVRKRQLQRGDARPLCAGAPPLAAMELELDGLLRRLAREVTTQYYAFGPVVACRARIAGKERTLYRAAPLDDIVLGALARVLADALESSLSPHLYSYRRGRSRAHALLAFRRYLRAHSRQRPDPRTRGLYVIRRDIRNYGDAIPCQRDSALWSQLRAALAHAGVAVNERLMHWLRAAFRPPVQHDTLLEEPARGVPTGSPLQPLACNLYLGPLDALCAAMPGALYARYGDDVLFAHPDVATARAAAQAIDDCIAALGLTPNPDKSAAFYFTRPGRGARDAQFRSASAIDYLGVRVDFRGAFGLPRAKQRSLFADLRLRLRCSRRLLTGSGVPAAERVQVLGAVVNASLCADAEARLAHDIAHELCHVVDDREQLRQFDYQISRLVSASLTGDTSPRALRRYPPRRLRREARLISLLARRNGGAS